MPGFTKDVTLAGCHCFSCSFVHFLWGGDSSELNCHCVPAQKRKLLSCTLKKIIYGFVWFFFFFFGLELLLFRYWTYRSGPLIFLPFSPIIHLLVLLFHFWWSSSFSPSVILVSPWHRHFHICQAVFQLLTPTTLGWDLSVPMTALLLLWVANQKCQGIILPSEQPSVNSWQALGQHISLERHPSCCVDP